MNLNTALELWFQHQNFHDTYISEIRRQFHLHMEPFINVSCIDTITNRQLRNAIEYMKEKQNSLYTISTFCQLQNRFFKYLTKSGILEKNPYSKDLNPKARANSFSTFSADEERRILEAIPHLPLHTLYLFCYKTGIKGQNARAILQENVYPEAGAIDIISTISGYPETIKPLDTAIVMKINNDFLESILSQSRGQRFLFPGNNGDFTTKTEVTSNNHMLKLLTGIPNVSLNHLAMHTNHKRSVK